MKGMDGAALACELSRRHPDGLPPILLLTSRGQVKDEAGEVIARRMVKPVKPSDLMQALCDALAGSARSSRTRPGFATPRNSDTEFAARHPLRILIAEDVQVNRKVIDLYLSRLGYYGTGVANGQEVLDALEHEPYDVILMDMQMPEMDGMTATRHLRSRPGCERHPYIIALTAHALTEHQTSALEVGMQDFLTKPLRSDSLAAALARAHAWLSENPRPVAS
jgi:CheY-like chemotaxis protein